jgi:hypothetical protein
MMQRVQKMDANAVDGNVNMYPVEMLNWHVKRIASVPIISGRSNSAVLANVMNRKDCSLKNQV